MKDFLLKKRKHKLVWNAFFCNFTWKSCSIAHTSRKNFFKSLNEHIKPYWKIILHKFINSEAQKSEKKSFLQGHIKKRKVTWIKLSLYKSGDLRKRIWNTDFSLKLI